MPPTGRMRHLTTVQGSFHGRVVAARLGAEGILVELRGMSEGPYPLQGAVEVFVGEEQLDLAREILLADAVDAAVDGDLVELEQTMAQEDDVAREWPPAEATGRARRAQRLFTAAVVALVVALVVVGIVTVAG